MYCQRAIIHPYIIQRMRNSQFCRVVSHKIGFTTNMLNLKMVLVEPSRVEIIYQVTKRTQARGSLLDRLHHPHGVTFKDNLLETQLNAQIYTLLQSHGLRIGWVSDIRYRFGHVAWTRRSSSGTIIPRPFALRLCIPLHPNYV